MTVEREGWWNVHEDDCAGLPRGDMRLWQYGGNFVNKEQATSQIEKGSVIPQQIKQTRDNPVRAGFVV